jgi:hypothetical protein
MRPPDLIRRRVARDSNAPVLLADVHPEPGGVVRACPVDLPVVDAEVVVRPAHDLQMRLVTPNGRQVELDVWRRLVTRHAGEAGVGVKLTFRAERRWPAAFAFTVPAPRAEFRFGHTPILAASAHRGCAPARSADEAPRLAAGEVDLNSDSGEGWFAPLSKLAVASGRKPCESAA